MRSTRLIAATIVFAGILAACGREAATDTARPASPNNTAPVAVVATPSDAQPGYPQELERLLKAAQGLRGPVKALAQMQPGPQRTVAIAMAHQALNVTNQAMLQLPPGMRAAPAPATGPMGSQPDNPQSVETLQKAAEQLSKSVQAMVDEPAGERREAAVKAALQALYDTNQAMIRLPEKAAGKS